MSIKSVRSAFAALVIVFCALIVIRFTQPYGDRPMFSYESADKTGFLATWRGRPPLRDKNGNHAFVDTELNLIVIVTRLRDQDDNAPPKHLLGVDKSILFPSTECSVTIESKRDTLILVNTRCGEKSFHLSHGKAISWLNDPVFNAPVYSDPSQDLLDSVILLYNGRMRPELQLWVEETKAAREP